jgi:hypothetical protein
MRMFLETLCIILGLILTTSAVMAAPANWSPDQATGAPDTSGAGDKPTAWATLGEDRGDEWLKLEYRTEVRVATVRVYENFNPGAIVKVTAFKSDGTEEAIWQGQESINAAPNIFEVTAKQNIKSKSIKIYLDTRLVRGWNEIDAVQLVGKDDSTQWAWKASASSTYASSRGGVNSISYESLPPSVVKTVPQAGDIAVDPSVNEVRVTFSKDMKTDRMWSFAQISNDTFPKIPSEKKIGYVDNRTCVMPVELKPNTLYVIWINQAQFNSFRDTQNNPSVPYLLVFKTKSE